MTTPNLETAFHEASEKIALILLRIPESDNYETNSLKQFYQRAVLHS